MVVVGVFHLGSLIADILFPARCTLCQIMPFIEQAYKETPKLTIYGQSVAAQAPAAEWGTLAKTVAEECSCGGGGKKLALC